MRADVDECILQCLLNFQLMHQPGLGGGVGAAMAVRSPPRHAPIERPGVVHPQQPKETESCEPTVVL